MMGATPAMRLRSAWSRAIWRSMWPSLAVWISSPTSSAAPISRSSVSSSSNRSVTAISAQKRDIGTLCSSRAGLA
jgi:hypothetical protein